MFGDLVRQLVADQRLQVVVEVGEQQLCAALARSDGLVGFVDEFDDQGVAEVQHDVAGKCALADIPLRGGVDVADGHSERHLGEFAGLGQERFSAAGDAGWLDPEIALKCLDCESMQGRRVAHEGVRP
jgi:hypothetical protein